MDPLMSWRERQPSLPRPGLQFDTQSIREQEEEEEDRELKAVETEATGKIRVVRCTN